MSTILQKYGAALGGFLVVLLTAVSSIQDLTPVTIFQIIALGLTSVGTFFVPLAPSGWRGGFKVGVELLGALVVAFIPFLVAGDWSQKAILLIVIALIKTGATQLSIVIRQEVPVAKQEADGSYTVTSLVEDPASVPTPAVADGQTPQAAI